MSDIRIRRWLFLSLVATTIAAGIWQFWSVLGADGLDGLEILVLSLFAILFGWIAISFWLTLFGAFAKWSGTPVAPLAEASGPSASRTAILMPVYNEDVARVFAGIEAIWHEAAAQGGFDFFILSDSTDPAHWIAEEVEWRRLRDSLPAQARLFYRHRHRNAGRKSGNVQDFCENWGALYDYMVVLDADSLMTGRSLRRLVAMMDANPRAALIQAPAQLAGRSSLFARIQQFASAVYGPVHSAGLAWLQGPEGNYWGHNAIIRIRPFMAHCGLPSLGGKPPFGGEIMSHDFVEAAFLVRAGWEVWMAPQLGGSYEEPPPTVLDFLKRDRRWCQGNLQHLRIVFAQGLKMPSRLHLATGIMTYLSAPLWLLLLAASAALAAGLPALPPLHHGGDHPFGPAHAGELLWLASATLGLLYGPKLFAALCAWNDAALTREVGGRRALVLSVLAESIFSTLLAPAILLTHSWFVISIVFGISTGWGPQQRQDHRPPLRAVARKFAPHSLAGASATALLAFFMPGSLGWFAPLLAGLLLAVPLAWISAGPRSGMAAARRNLFLVGSETATLPVLARTHHLLAERPDRMGKDFRRLVLDDQGVRALHLQLLRETPPPAPPPPELLGPLAAAAHARELEHFSPRDWTLLLSDAETLSAFPI